MNFNDVVLTCFISSRNTIFGKKNSKNISESTQI